MSGHVDSNGILWNSKKVGSFMTYEDLDSGDNCYDTLKNAAAKHLERRCAGQRKFIERIVQPDGLEKWHLGKYEWITYGEYFQRVENFGSGLAKISDLKKGDTVVIYADTQRDWMVAAYGAWRQGLVVGTIYATLGADGALFGINQSKCKAVVADGKLLKVLAKKAGEYTTLKHIITIDEPDEESSKLLAGAGIQMYAMEELTSKGADEPQSADPAKADDTAVLMYTSGTTGNPKGVLISHGSIMAVIASTKAPGAALTKVGGGSYISSDAIYLAYLPLAHIMELAVEVTLFCVGATIGYGNVGSLLATSPKMMAGVKQKGDAAELRPTVFVAAPAVLDRIFAVINGKIAAKGGIVKCLFESAIASGRKNFDKGGVGATSASKIIFKPMQKLLGGRVSAFLTGSAPLGADVQKFVQSVFNCPTRQGYGLTETSAATCITNISDNSTSVVGPPQMSACIRLRDWEEGGYRAADLDDKKIGMRRGEVLIGGPGVCSGYLVDEENPDVEVQKKNEEDFVTIDGIRYFCTGDIGQYNKDGNLQIIDRKKDLVKLQMGEYVALSKVENVVKNSKYTELPMTYADPNKDYCIVLICPMEGALNELAKSLNVAGDKAALCKDPKIIENVTADVQAVCKGKLQKFEVPKKVILIDDLFTPENGMLTAVRKLKRPQIVAKHKHEIDPIYV